MGEQQANHLCRYATEDLPSSSVEKQSLHCTEKSAMDRGQVDRGRRCDKGSITRSQGVSGRSEWPSVPIHKTRGLTRLRWF